MSETTPDLRERLEQEAAEWELVADDNGDVFDNLANLLREAAAALAVPRQPCGAAHEQTGAMCDLPAGHSQNHRGPFTHGIAQWPAEKE